MSLTEAPPRGPRAAPLGPASPSRPLVAELVGPAGAGKTALLRAIGTHNMRIRAGLRIDLVQYLPTLAGHALALAPVALELLRNEPRSFRLGLLHLLRLRTLATVLGRWPISGEPTVLFDEGPLFSLGRLSVFQRANEGDTRFAQAWHEQLEQWTQRLDVVIWLDAPDPVLAQRIRSRPKEHRVKAEADQAVFEFLGRYRRAYREIRARLTASGRVRMIDVDTTTLSAEQAVPVVLAALAPGPTTGSSRDR